MFGITENNKNDLIWRSSFIEFKKYLFFLLVFFSVAGNVLDIVFLSIEVSYIGIYINLINIALVLLIAIFVFIKPSFLYYANAIAIYALILNMLVSLHIDFQNDESAYFFLRETIFIGILILFAGFVLNKRHIIYIGILYFISFLKVLIFGESDFLAKNAILLIAAEIAYGVSFYYLMNMLVTNHIKQNLLLEEFKNQNDQLKSKTIELEKLNNTKNKLFSVITHDLKNPFGNLVGYSDLIIKNIKKENWEKVEYLGKMVDKSSRNACNLLNNLFNWSLSQTNRITFTPGFIDIFILIEKAVDLVENQAEIKNISIVKDVEPFKMIEADENIISIVLNNLLSNAIKYTRPGGEVSIKCETDEDNVVFRVKDNGVGISEPVKNRLFKIDENISSKGTDEESGTGLGLMICKELITVHNGKIWVESKEDQGSEFIFSIPIK